MNDEDFYSKDYAREGVKQANSEEEYHRSGIRLAHRLRLPRAAGLAMLFFPIASVLVAQPVNGVWWLLLVGWAFVWPHLAWQLAVRAADPLQNEMFNLKVDAIMVGVWSGLMGVNAMPTAALVMMMSMNLMGVGGIRLYTTGAIMSALAALVTLQLMHVPTGFVSTPLEVWLSLPGIVGYPMLFAWVSYRTTSRLVEHKRRLELMSTLDGMTGVFNRRHWEVLLRTEFENCRRYHRSATILLIDIDHFKGINDTWGHDIGDQAIIAVTRQLQLTLRASDLIGRFGGDEFAVIMSGTPAENAIAAMSRVHERLAELRLPGAPQVKVCISVGVAPLTTSIVHYQEWLKAADIALYKAKNAGRNRTEVAA
ncbi:diguanylate cyclase AdrA [Leclercia adecarboxylata]|nr:diguanylate cyclase AdrA [Leclercia adecarboxylata]